MEEHVLENISSLLIQESDLLLGLEPYFIRIEELLHEKSNLESADKEFWDNLIHSIEDAIRELLQLSDNRCKAYALLQYYLVFVGGHHKELLCVMLVVFLLDYFKLVQRLSHICDHMWERGGKTIYAIFQSGSFHIGPPYTRNTAIFRAITHCEALVAKHQFGPTVARQVTQLCDQFNSFHNLLKDVEIEKLTEEQAAWIDEVFNVCSSAYHVASRFLVSLQHREAKNKAKELIVNAIQFRNFKSQQKLAKQLTQIIEHAKDVADRRPQLISTPVSLRDSVRSLTLACDSTQLDLHSFHEDVDAILEKLMVEDAHCIKVSIVGVSGIGKSSLAKLVYDNEVVVNRFPHRLWVSGTTEMEIMENIFGVGSYHLFDRNIEITNTVFADKRLLIVVECSIARDFWGKMNYIFLNLCNGSRIIFTARTPAEAPRDSDTNFNYRLHLRSDDESWGLFMYTLKLNISSQVENKMKKKILRKCGGLPKDIVNLAHFLSGRETTPEEWSRVLEQLNPDQEPWLQIIEKINKYVPLDLRRCLFYFGLFPANYRIPARRLINLWVAEGLAQGNADGTSVEGVAEQYLEELTNSDMVHVTERKLNGKIKTCCLPEALRLHWLAKAKATNFIQGPRNFAHGIRRLAGHVIPNDGIFQDIHGNRSTYIYPNYRNTVSFLSFDHNRDDAGTYVGTFLGRCISKSCFLFLWVLDLEKVFRPKFPKLLSKLTNLRYLGLRRTDLDNLPKFINKLLSLQTLDLKGTSIDTLPTVAEATSKNKITAKNQTKRTPNLTRFGQFCLRPQTLPN